MTKRKNTGGLTASELSRRLANDPAYQAKVSAQARQAAVTAESEHAVLVSLAEAGYEASSLTELLEARDPLPNGLARALLTSLSQSTSNNVKEMIVRVLGRVTEPFDAQKLVALFEETEVPALRWAIANTMAETRPVSIAAWIAEAVRKRSYGKAREMLTLALARTSPPSIANPVLVDLLADLAGHAALALAETGGTAELEPLKRAKQRAKGWERSAIAKAIAVIERRLAEGSRR